MFILDFERATNDFLNNLNASNGELIDYWNDIEHFTGKRKEIDFLKDVRKIKNFDELNVEIFKGRKGKKLRDDAVPPYNHISYTWESKGVHHKDALQSTGVGGIGKIDPLSSKIDIGPSGLGYYKAKVKIWHPDFPPNGAWLTKNSKGGMSNFFPDSWTKQKLQEELALAFKNKTFQKNNIWHGVMSDGIKVQFHIDNGIIKTAFPIF